MQAIVNATPTAGEGARVAGMISALVGAGIDGGYLINPWLAKVHWQAGDRALPAPAVSVAGESVLWVDPAEIPSDGDIGELGLALAAGRHGDRDELMANTAAYSGLRSAGDRCAARGRPHRFQAAGGAQCSLAQVRCALVEEDRVDALRPGGVLAAQVVSGLQQRPALQDLRRRDPALRQPALGQQLLRASPPGPGDARSLPRTDSTRGARPFRLPPVPPSPRELAAGPGWPAIAQLGRHILR
jgi:hypothetical protein